ncbi:MAG: polysaccharide deacetylase, partial [Candidatus Omnitrophica bacterium]|nr:polysaccharide deacetylase [Candidatus Omnitrophota bacterium]
MTKKIFLTFIFVLISSQLAADESFLAMSAFKSELIEQSGGSLSWAEKVPGVMTHLDTKDNVIAITLNACGTPGDGYDDRVVGYLKRGRIPATIFVSGLW